MNSVRTIVLLVVIVVVVGGGYIYWQQQQATAAAADADEAAQAREAFLEERGGDAMLRTVGDGTLGEVVSVEGNTVVIKDDAGVETSIILAADGKVVRPTEGQRADMHPGDMVTVLTQDTDDGKMAMMVQLGGSGDVAGGGPLMTAPLVINGDTPNDAPSATGAIQMPAITSLTGIIETIEENSITIAPVEGEPVTIALTANTRIQTTETLTLADLEIGTMVSTLGEKQEDGHVDATEITVLPEPMMMPAPEP